MGDLYALFRQHVRAQRIAHDTAHDGLRNIANRLVAIAYPVQIPVWVLDAVLNHPLHVNDLEVARQHQRLFAMGRLLFVAGAVPGGDGPKTEFLL